MRSHGALQGGEGRVRRNRTLWSNRKCLGGHRTLETIDREVGRRAYPGGRERQGLEETRSSNVEADVTIASRQIEGVLGLVLGGEKADAIEL